MRSLSTLSIALGIALLAAHDVSAQCQRGGGGGARQPASVTQDGGFTQASFNPQLAMQFTAQLQALMRQQLALQQMRMQQIALQQQARQAKLARRREGARERRLAELARREQIRSENLARRDASEKAQTTFVALRDE